MPVGHLYAFFVFLTFVCADGLIFGQFQLVITLGCVSHLGDGRSLIMVMARVQEIGNACLLKLGTVTLRLPPILHWPRQVT